MPRLLLFYLFAACSIVLTASCGTPPKASLATLAADAIYPLSSTPQRGGNTPTYVRPKVYDYAPTVLMDKGVYRMWWCGGIAGDHILHAEAQTLAGPWHAHGSTVTNSFDDVFGPTKSLDDYDGQHTCDPSVITVNGTYYLYYGAAPIASSKVMPDTTYIGVATSPDGLKWARASKKALISPARDFRSVPNKYGAGQPTCFFHAGYFHLAYTDTTGIGANKVNGAGIFVWRSKSGTFASGVEQLTATGWVPRGSVPQSSYAIADAFSVDWAWSAGLQSVVLARVTGSGIALDIYDENLKVKTYGATVLPGAWHDGPGLVRTSWGHLPLARGGKVAVDLMRAVSDSSGDTSPNGWDLGWLGGSLAVP